MILLCKKCIERLDFGAEGDCILCGNIFDRLDEITEKITSELENYQFDSFDLGIRLHGSIASMIDFLRERYGIEDSFKDYLRNELIKCISAKTEKKRRINGDIRITFYPEDLSFEIDVKSIYIYGRYIKRVRDLSQTRWVCKNCNGKGCEICNFQGKKYLSVEELIINPAVELFQGDNGFLHGAGREDVDVRMLGTGRPFILEISKPKRRNVNLEELETLINRNARGKIEVTLLHYANAGDVVKLKNASFSKIYRAVVRFDCKIEEERIIEALERLENTVICQRTPKRVEHRRSDKIRERRVYSAKLILIKNRLAVIELHSESGMYIKELVSGDGGRTRPSLFELTGCECHVEKLDVIAVRGGLEDGNLKYNPPAFKIKRR